MPIAAILHFRFLTAEQYIQLSSLRALIQFVSQIISIAHSAYIYIYKTTIIYNERYILPVSINTAVVEDHKV